MSLARGPAKILTGDIFAQTDVQIAPAEFSDGGHTRPILKIQDGCNNRCSYCVIPFVRGKSRSLPPNVVVAEIRKLVEAGAKEVVLSGINLGSYGRDLAPRSELIETARRILDETDLEQLRFSSIEPQDVTENLSRSSLPPNASRRIFTFRCNRVRTVSCALCIAGIVPNIMPSGFA